jgi:acyl-CoA hydrolase
LSGPVSTARSDVDWVVTEHGARSLKGLSVEQRAAALVELAGAAHAAALGV